jgi:Flp pilus assembly protein TadD
LALALEADNHCQPARAVRHYVQSLRLNAKQPLCLHDLGCLRIQLGQVNAGLRLLSQAVRLAPDEPRYLEALAWALLDAGKASLAWKFVLRARFQQRNDPRFADVLKRFRFAAVRSEQAGPQAVEPITLPFVPVPPKPPTGTGKRRGRLVRLDRASRPKPHFFAWKADSRRLS